MPLWDWITPDLRKGSAGSSGCDPAPVGSAASDGRFPARAEGTDCSTDCCAILLAMSWEAGFTGELDQKSGMVQSPRAGLISILLLTTKNQTFQVGLKGIICVGVLPEPADVLRQ